MKHDSGYNLVALFNSGDDKAFRAIYQELCPGVFLLADKMLKGFQVNGFWWALFFSLLLSIVTSVLYKEKTDEKE